MEVFKIQKDLINKENAVIFDVGAHHGKVSRIYLDLMKQSHIYAFEPYKDSFNVLVNNSIDTNIHSFNVAVGEENKKVELFVNISSPTNSIFPTHDDSTMTWEGNYCITKDKVCVDMITIDKFVEDNNIKIIDILKIDTQGTEFNVIKGAQKTIRENKIKLVYTEIITMPTYVGQKYLDEILEIFRLNDFYLYNIYDQSYTKDKRLRQIDAIFLHKSFYNFKSQYGQDEYISSLLDNKRDGYFVELGACDGMMFSNSFYFEKELGWKGVLIEPNPHFWEDLKSNRRCNVSNKICDDVEGKEVDFLIAGPISGVVNDKSGYWVKQNINNEKIKLTTTTLGKVLDEFNAPNKIDFLSLDVEGVEYDILNTFPFEKYEFHYMCIEHNKGYDGVDNKNKIRELLTNKGYTLIKEDTIDDFYENKNF